VIGFAVFKKKPTSIEVRSFLGRSFQKAGKTPIEVYENIVPANNKPRYELRSRWPHGSPCASPQTMIKGRRGTKLVLAISVNK
jgi:hypothetical protein